MAEPSKGVRLLLGTCVASLLLAALTAVPAHAGSTWFVSEFTGSDANVCNQSNLPCQTINGAIGKAQPFDVIFVTADNYTSQAAEVVRVNKSLTFSGGWDLNFSAKAGYTILYGDYQRRGLFVEKGASVYMDNFAIVFCQGNFGGGAYVEGSLIGFHMFIAGNRALAGGGGLFFNGRVGDSVGLIDSAVFLNETASLGGGIFVYGSHFIAEGVLSAVQLYNVTVSNNVSITTGDGEGGTLPSAGGGVYVQDGFLYTAHATFAENSVFDGFRHIQNGAGIAAFTSSGTYPGARIQLLNTLIADGCSLTNAQVFRGGVNLERTNTCGLNPMLDKVNVDPRIYPIDANGGPFTTLTHAIALNSPALDGADTQICKTQTGNPPHDQRGVTRPQGPGCDIGAYERAPDDRPSGAPLAWARTGRPRHNRSRVEPAELIEAVLGALDDRDDDARSFSGRHDHEERVPQDSPDVRHDRGPRVR